MPPTPYFPESSPDIAEPAAGQPVTEPGLSLRRVADRAALAACRVLDRPAAAVVLVEPDGSIVMRGRYGLSADAHLDPAATVALVQAVAGEGVLRLPAAGGAHPGLARLAADLSLRAL